MSIFGNSKTSSYDKTGDLVYLFAKNKIKMNSILTVEPNQVAYVMVNDKITDEFLPGSYTLSVAVLPISARALKLQKKMNNAKSIIKSITADLYIVSKEQTKFDEINSFHFVIKDKEFGRVETKANFSCELKLINPMDFLAAIRKFVAVVEKGMAAKLLKELAQDAVSSVMQKLNLQIRNIMTKKDEAEELIFEKFVEKMQNIGIEVISFSMNKLLLKKSIADIFENVPSFSTFENKPEVKTENENQTIILEKVGMQGDGDRGVEATLIKNNESQNINEVLNVKDLNTFESKPRREFRINLGDNSFLTSSGIENVENSSETQQPILDDRRQNIFERRREENAGLSADRRENVLNNNRNEMPEFSARDVFSNRRDNIFEKRTCKNCGKELSLDDEFCSKCGTKVEK